MMDILDRLEWSAGAAGTYERSALLVKDGSRQRGVPRHSQPNPDGGLGPVLPCPEELIEITVRLPPHSRAKLTDDNQSSRSTVF